MRDFTVFPEVRPEDAEFSHGVEITICTTADEDAAAKVLLIALGFPFQKDTSKADAAEEARRQTEKEAQEAAAEAAKAAGLFEEDKPKEESVENSENSEKPEDSKANEDPKKEDDSKK